MCSLKGNEANWDAPCHQEQEEEQLCPATWLHLLSLLRGRKISSTPCDDNCERICDWFSKVLGLSLQAFGQPGAAHRPSQHQREQKTKSAPPTVVGRESGAMKKDLIHQPILMSISPTRVIPLNQWAAVTGSATPLASLQQVQVSPWVMCGYQGATPY